MSFVNDEIQAIGFVLRSILEGLPNGIGTVVADAPEVEGSQPVAPTLEDLYLYVFRSESPAARFEGRGGSHFKEARHG